MNREEFLIQRTNLALASRPLQKKLNLTTPLFIFITILSISMLQYSIYLIHNNILDKSIKIVCILLLLLSIKNFRLSNEYKKILFRYFALFGSAFVGAVITLDIIGLLQLSKIVFMFLIFPVILLAVPPKCNPPGILLKMPLFWGVLFSIQSIILSLIIFFGIPIKPNIIELGSYGTTEVSYGILGYANALQTFSQRDYTVLRAQGWFIEPSILAAFLIYPVFVSFGYYKSTKKKRYILISSLCLICMVLTFSLAGFLSVLASIVFLMCIRSVSKKPGNNKTNLIKRAYPLIVAIGFIILAQFVMSKLQNLYNPSTWATSAETKFIARNPQGPSGSLFREYYKLDIYTEKLKKNILGIGLGHTLGTNELTSANALVYWIIAGGIPALIILFLLYSKLFFTYCLPLLQSKQLLYRYIGAAFVGTTVHGLGYGNWINPFYLYVIAVMILCAIFVKEQDRKLVGRRLEKMKIRKKEGMF